MPQASVGAEEERLCNAEKGGMAAVIGLQLSEVKQVLEVVNFLELTSQT